MNQYNYRLDLSYRGTDFQGWQTQPEKNAIQDHLNKALSIFLRRDVTAVGSSRTDSGVHAEHQVAMFKHHEQLNSRSFIRGINALLPNDISIQSVSPVEDEFHPIRSSTGKLYRYSLYLGDGISPFLRDYVWRIYGLNTQLLIDCLPHFVGQKNFRSFCAKDASAKTFVRKINFIEYSLKDNYLDLFILGEGFLKQMIRNIVGTLIDLSQGKMNLNQLEAIFAGEDRQLAGRTAPASGLCLLQVFYGQIPLNLESYRKSKYSFPIGIGS